MGPFDKPNQEMYEDARKPLPMREQAINGGSAAMAAQGMLDRGSRESARTLLERRIRELEQKSIALRELSNALPMNLPPMADEALWQMLVAIR